MQYLVFVIDIWYLVKVPLSPSQYGNSCWVNAKIEIHAGLCQNRNSCWVYSNNGKVRGAGVGTAGTCTQSAKLPASVIILSSSGATVGAGKKVEQALQDIKNTVSSICEVYHFNQHSPTKA